MYWDYQEFPRHPFSTEKFETRGRNTNIFNCDYRVDPKLGKCVCSIRWNPCECTYCVDQYDKYLLLKCAPTYL